MSRPRVPSPNTRHTRARSPANSFDIVWGPGADVLVSAEAPVSRDIGDLLALPLSGSRSHSRSQSRLRNVIGDGDDISFADLPSPSTPGKPWYRRPSPWWILIMISLSTVVTSMTLAPKTEVYIRLVCAAYKPEYTLNGPNGTINPLSSTASFGGDSSPMSGFWTKVPRPSIECASDPEVGKKVAALGTTVTLTLGLVSSITTGWWSKLSDRAGRVRVLGLGILGILLSDMNFILVTLFSHRFPEGYRFMITGSVLDGMMGGLYTAMAAAHAYISDCADPSARAQMFSLYMGMVFVGMAIGPSLGGLLITRTGDMLSVFYFATATHTFYAIVAWFFMPESLSSETMTIIAERVKSKGIADRERRNAARRNQVFQFVRDVFSFLEPLAVFWPRKRRPGEEGSGRDWNLTCIAISFCGVHLIIASYPFKFQFAEAVFHWGSEQVGYWLTAVGAVRAVHLIIVLPLIIRTFGPQRLISRGLDVERDDPTQPLLGNIRDPSLTPSHSSRVNHLHAHHTAQFDLLVARCSIIIDFLSYVFMCLLAGPHFFIMSSLSTSFGSGFGPATQSLALSLMPSGGEDAGKLFGGLSVISAITSQVVGPLVFATTYIATIDFFPKAIFALACILLGCSIISLSLVRLPPHPFNISSSP